MFTNQDIIAVLFRLINFATLIGIGFFLFKKHIMPDLLASIIRKKEHLDSLSAQQAALEKQQLALDTFLKEDILLCAQFRSKIDTWKKAVALETTNYEKEQTKTLSACNRRASIIALQREHKRVQTIVTHAVINDLKKSLSLHFKEQKQSSDYLNSIITFMNERTS